MRTAGQSFVATAATGTEPLVVSELRELGLRAKAHRPGLVRFDGSPVDAARACLHSRVAVRVLLALTSCRCASREELYEGSASVDWPAYIGPHETIAVSAKAAPGSLVPSSAFAALVVKDAIADRMRDERGARPSVDRREPDVRILVHLGRSEAELYLDCAGEPLHRRGYRVAPTAAPLKETLAAAVVRLGRFDGSRPLVDAMTGSGTLAIEAALKARRISPRAHKPLAIEAWSCTDESCRRDIALLRQEAMGLALEHAPCSIHAYDVDPSALMAARRNAANAGVEADILFEKRDARELETLPGALIVMNPPYGDRQGSGPDLEALYRALGGRLRALRGRSLVVLSGNRTLERCMGLAPEWSHRVQNGPIECEVLYYEIGQ